MFEAYYMIESYIFNIELSFIFIRSEF